MEIGGYNDVPDLPKMGSSLLIATCLIVAIRIAVFFRTRHGSGHQWVMSRDEKRQTVGRTTLGTILAGNS